MRPQELEPETRTSAPGQKGFAQRYMEKMGWKKGEGLGKEATGITTILRHEATKRKRKGDAEGGGWAQPAAMGRIVGGKKTKSDVPIDEAKAFSLVARFEGMLRDMDVDRAIEEDNLMQRIGEKLDEYGRSERVFIDRATGRVFVKFTSALSAFNVSLVSVRLDDTLADMIHRLTKQATARTFWAMDVLSRVLSSMLTNLKKVSTNNNSVYCQSSLITPSFHCQSCKILKESHSLLLYPFNSSSKDFSKSDSHVPTRTSQIGGNQKQ
jgi:hypothetical protein